jgi:predicted DNA-binding protein with PD1-like motif
VVVLETGEEVMSCLQQFVSEQNIRAAQLTAIGAFHYDRKPGAFTQVSGP